MKTLHITDILRHKSLIIKAPDDQTFTRNEKILIKAPREVFIAEVQGLSSDKKKEKVDTALNFLRKINKEELEKFDKSQNGEKARVQKAQALSSKHKLKMKVFASRVGWHEKVFSFFFISESPVDFRGLLKDLIKEFPGRIHLERVNERDQPEILDIPNHCGQAHCCAVLPLSNKTVTLNAVRDQSIMIRGNEKIFGICGKIKRCMLYEVDTYKENRKYLPHIRQEVLADGQKARVIGVDILNKKVRVEMLNEKRVEILPVANIQYENKKEAPLPKIKEERKLEIDMYGVGI